MICVSPKDFWLIQLAWLFLDRGSFFNMVLNLMIPSSSTKSNSSPWPGNQTHDIPRANLENKTSKQAGFLVGPGVVSLLGVSCRKIQEFFSIHPHWDLSRRLARRTRCFDNCPLSSVTSAAGPQRNKTSSHNKRAWTRFKIRSGDKEILRKLSLWGWCAASMWSEGASCSFLDDIMVIIAAPTQGALTEARHH